MYTQGTREILWVMENLQIAITFRAPVWLVNKIGVEHVEGITVLCPSLITTRNFKPCSLITRLTLVHVCELAVWSPELYMCPQVWVTPSGRVD